MAVDTDIKVGGRHFGIGRWFSQITKNVLIYIILYTLYSKPLQLWTAHTVFFWLREFLYRSEIVL